MSWLGRIRSVRKSTLIIAIALAASLLNLPPLLAIANHVHANTGHDFLLVFAAAAAIRDHQNPYDAATFLRYALATGIPRVLLVNSQGVLGQPYVYPPLFAWLVIPLTSLSPHSALFVWRIVCMGSIALGTMGLMTPWARERASGVLASRANRLLLAALVTTSPMAFYCIYWGNAVAISYAAIGASVWALSQRSQRADVLAGVLMAGALLKPQLTLPLALLGVVCLARGKNFSTRVKRIALGLGVTTGLLLVLDVLVTGPALLLAWPGAVRSLTTVPQPDMPSLAGLLRLWLLQTSYTVERRTPYVVLFLGFVAAILVYWRCATRWPPERLWAMLTVLWCFATPYSHGNDDLLYIPGALVLVAALPELLARVRTAWRGMSTWTRLAGALPLGVALVALALLWRGAVLNLDIIFSPNYAARERVARWLVAHISLFALAPTALLVALVTYELWGRRDLPVATGDGPTHGMRNEMPLERPREGARTVHSGQAGT